MATKRLTKELGQYAKNPSPAVPRLEPTNEHDLFHLTADLRGPEGTAYEGEPKRDTIGKPCNKHTQSKTIPSPRPIEKRNPLETSPAISTPDPKRTYHTSTSHLAPKERKYTITNQDSPFHPTTGGLFTLHLTIPPTYPNNPPTITFATPCCHPNVSFSTGEICLDLLKSAWTPAYGLVSSLEAVQQLLSAGGEADSPLNLDVARLVREGDLVGAEALVRLYTRLYAMG